MMGLEKLEFLEAWLKRLSTKLETLSLKVEEIDNGLADLSDTADSLEVRVDELEDSSGKGDE